MGYCWAVGCNHHNQREKCKFFTLPKDTKTRNKWLKLLRRSDQPGRGCVVCSCHFKNGLRINGPELQEHLKKAFNNDFPPPSKKIQSIKKITIPSIPIDMPSCETNTQNALDVDRDMKSKVDENSEIEILNLNKKIDLNLDSKSVSVLPTQSIQSVTVLETENYFLKNENEKLKSKLYKLSVAFSYETICNSDELVNLYTGLPNSAVFNSLFEMFKDVNLNYFLGWNVKTISPQDQLLLTLMKLRNKNKLCLPNAFSSFTNCRIIIDCTEFPTDVTRKSMVIQKSTYSNYKHYHTLKALIGVAPNGIVTFCSNLFPGSTSDKILTLHSGLLAQLEEGDLVLADKGFLIRDILPNGVHLNIPPFLDTPQFTKEQIYLTETIARARIHVERAIRRIKCYRILNHIPTLLLPHSDCIFKVVSALTNLKFPLIKEIQDKM
ncbi:uncharacterized protein LOC126549819 [Aphis gossypii]|uniref:uncharacterized protein LOC126549819 n=1 Tax=Aphis gossypii TaxID=80765 RepID=UPI002158E75F|nr:uncharacterized protein LOC126549819 [Aphis gossypii]